MSSSCWPVDFVECPLALQTGRNDGPHGILQHSCIAHVKVPLNELLKEKLWVLQESPKTIVRVALADYVARQLSSCSFRELSETALDGSVSFQLETLDKTKASTSRRHHQQRRQRNSRSNGNSSLPPFMLERTDVWCQESSLHIFLRVLTYTVDSMHVTEGRAINPSLKDESFCNGMATVTTNVLRRLLISEDEDREASPAVAVPLLSHIATAVLQERLRAQLPALEAVAFVANGSILPRRNGVSSAPMASPPAIPFSSPRDSPMARTVEVQMGRLYPCLNNILSTPTSPLVNGLSCSNETTVAILSGLLIPRGVSLIVGGGYHGKSTLLRTIAAGVYNKLPGDGREFCVTSDSAVTIRAEDGRYVNNCNVSAFISNLPTTGTATKDVTRGDDDDDADDDGDNNHHAHSRHNASDDSTTRFSSGEASGSTSQAANVVEAMEMGASTFLVDEDVSAANFMARDGRMRSLVMDESITPLLYRVNGLFNAKGISSIVVVGGVGDWLDVPQNVILMDRYVCHDATKKAHSISRQFSHGHVQYAGRGVVHRLPWEEDISKGGDTTGNRRHTPIPRRPTDVFSKQFDRNRTVISLLDGSDALSFDTLDHADEDISMSSDEDQERHVVDMSRCEQLMGKKPQLYGCGLCVLWLLEAAQQNPSLGLPSLLQKMDEFLDEQGFVSVVGQVGTDSSCWCLLVETLGCAYRPRKFEVGQALTRLRGIQLEEISVLDDGSEAAAKAEAERKKQELLDMWNSRRKNKLNGTGV